MWPEYFEINALKEFYTSQKIQVSILESSPVQDTFLAMLTLGNTSLEVLLLDEYNDRMLPNRLLHVVLVLKELEIIEESTDYLDWCNQQGFSTNDEFLLPYYQKMVNELPKLSSYFPKGKVTSFISDWDIQLDAGAAQFLRNTTY